jgi:hypothetical protein
MAGRMEIGARDRLHTLPGFLRSMCIYQPIPFSVAAQFASGSRWTCFTAVSGKLWEYTLHAS